MFPTMKQPIVLDFIEGLDLKDYIEAVRRIKKKTKEQKYQQRFDR